MAYELKASSCDPLSPAYYFRSLLEDQVIKHISFYALFTLSFER